MNRSRVGPLPAVQAGGWMAKEIPDIVMSSPEKAKFPASLVPALSTDGQLLCCLQGMIVAQSDPGGKSQSGLLLSSSREKTIAAYAANITMFPEGLKRATCDGTSPKVLSSQKSKHDFESSVDWSKEFSSPLLCSLQQRQVSFMKITVYSADSAKVATAAAAKCSKKNILGTALLDMSSLIDNDGSIQALSLPVKSNGSKRGHHVQGWLIIGLQYCQNRDKGVVPSMSSDEIRGKTSTAWMNVLCDPSIVSNRSVNNRNPDSDFENMFSTGIGTSSSRLEALNTETIAVHLAMGSLELTIQASDDSKSKSEYLYILQVRAGSPCCPVYEGMDGTSTAALTINTLDDTQPLLEDPSSGSAIAVIDATSGLLKWESADVTLSCMTNIIFTPVVYLSLHQGRRLTGNQIESGSSTLIGETTFFLPRASLTRGAPISIVAPLRDLEGTRVAMLQLGAQRTSLMHSAGPPVSSQLTGSTAPARLRSAARQREERQSPRAAPEDPNTCISVSFSIDEGSVTDPYWRLPVEPFFEFTLLPPKDNSNLLHKLRWRARTNFIGQTAAASSSSSSSERASDMRRSNQAPPSETRQSQAALPGSEFSRVMSAGGGPAPWGIGCSLLIPKSGFPVGPSDEMGRPIWGVAVVCRDASRVGCPEIAAARVGLPWSLLARGRAIDQWVVLLNAGAHGAQSEGVSLGMDMVMRSADSQDQALSSGRIRLIIACKSVIVDPKGLESSNMAIQESWGGVSALQQFQSQFFGGCTNTKRALGHTQVKGSIHPGIGASLIWLSGLASMRSGQEIEPMDITMATASSLVPPATSQSVYGGNDYDMASADNNDERLTFSELFFSPSGNTCRSRGDVTQTPWKKWEEDWMPAIPYLRGLCGSLPVAGGHSHLRLDVSVSHRKVPYTVSFSVLSGLTACMTPGQEYDPRDSSTVSSSSNFSIPAMDILMSCNEDHAAVTGAARGRKVFAQQLRGAVNSAPRLKLMTAFVPFVKGRLIVSCRSVRFAVSPWHSDGGTHRCAIRFAMSPGSFGFTPSFEIPSTTDTVITMPQLTPTTSPATKDLPTQILPCMLSKVSRVGGRDPNSQRSVSSIGALKNQSAAPGRQKSSDGTRSDPSSNFSVILPVDTLEFTSKGGSCSMLTLQVALLDLDGTGSLYSMGDGGVQTAPLYYQALRAASASRPLTVEASSSTAPDTVGVSPWLTTECAIYDKQRKEPVAWVLLSTQFLMEEMSPQVMSALSAARQSPAAGCGEVDPDHLSQNSPDFTNVVGGTYGGSDPEELLVLSGTRAISPYYPESRNGRPNTGAERVRNELGLKQAFLAADANGNGSVSVEELLAVIKKGSGGGQKSKGRRIGQPRGAVNMEDTVALLKSYASDGAAGTDSTRKNPDPLDTSEDAELEQVVRRIFSRLDVDGDGMISWWEWQASLSGALLGKNPCEKFIDPMDGLAVISQAAEDALTARTQLKNDCDTVFPAFWDTEYIDAAGSARLPMVESVASSVTRLQTEIASIRGWGGSSSTNALSPMANSNSNGRDSALVAAALKKQMEAEAVAEECRQAHKNESKKRSELEASLANLKRLNDEVRGARDDKEEATRKLREKLTVDAVGHQRNLDSIQAEKKGRLRATITIDMFLTRIAIPRYKRIQLERNRAVLSRALVKLIHRHRITKSIDLQTRATLLLQRMMRGVLHRMRLRRRQEAAVLLQRVYRGSKGRESSQRMLLDLTASCFSAKYLAAAKIKFYLQRFVKKIKAARHDAAVVLQRASRHRAEMKASTFLLHQNEEEKEKQRRDGAASLIGKAARGKAAVTAAKSHKDTLLRERLRDEESDSALRSIQRLRENVAAGVIQAASRGRAGRKRHSTLTEERDVQQAYVDRYKAVARSMRAILPKPTLKDAAGLWVRFQKQHERGAGSSDRASSSPVASPRGEVSGVLYPEVSSTKSSVPAVSVASHPLRSVVGPSQPLVSPRAPAPAAPPAIAAGPLLINFRDLTPIPVGTKVEALYGSESAWFPGTVTRIVPSQLNNGSSVSPQSISPRKKKVETQVDERIEEVLYHVQYDDGDEETCSRGKIKVPEFKEKQPGVLAVGQELHAECTTVGSTLRGVVLAGPFRSSEGLIQAEGAGAGTGGGAGPEDGYDVEFYTDDEKTKKVIERVKRKNITAPHLSAALVAELKEREAEKNEEMARQAALATRQVVVKQPSSSSRAHRTECVLSARREGLVSVALSRGEGPLHGLIGEVLRVDKHRRMMHVQLLNLRSLDYYIIELPYDHPRLLWFAFDPRDSDDTPDTVEHIQDLEESSIPTLNEAGEGYYVSYPVPGSNIERCAQVLSVSADKRTLEVYYQDVVNGLASDVTETLPYDLKELTWYKDESLEGQPALLSWVAQPALKDATGYFVEVRSLEPDAEKGDMFSGEVVGVDEEARIILVSFDCAEGSEVNDTDEDDVEMIPYDSPDIVWVSPPLCATSLVPKPPVALAVGYIVNVFDESRTSKNGPKNIIQGKIMSVNESNETVRVRFKNGNPDELFPMESMQIAWISEAPPSFLSQSLVSRPKLPHAVGYEVEVSFREAGDEKGQSLHGEVVSVDKEANTVRVRFQGSNEAELDANCEDLEYFSADIAWMRKVGPIFARSLVPRPSLVDAVGYRVDVKSHQPDHDPNDVFVGEIVSVNAAAGTMRVRFDGAQGSAGDEDEEEFDYTSPDVAWMERSPATGDEFSGLPIYQQSHEKTAEGVGANKGSITAGSVSGEESTAYKSKKPAVTAGRRASREEPDTLQSALPRPSMQSAVGYDVAVLDIGGELAEGVVCAVDMQRRALLILFHERIAVAPSAVTSGVTGREHYYAFESSAVAWMREPTPCLLSLSQVPRPPIALCVGYEVDVKSHDPGAEDDDVFLGTVVSVSPLIRAIHVVFKGVGGAQADEEALCYDSKDIAWRQPPRLVPNPRPVSAATAPTTDGAVSVEATTRLDQSNISKPQSAETSTKRRPPPIVPPQRAIKWDLLESKKPTSPPPLDAAVGRYIVVCDIDGDMRGKVVGVSRKMLQIKLLDEDDVEDDEVIELQYSSLSIRWFQNKDKEGGG